jgi:outer membrane protein insertion porin family
MKFIIPCGAAVLLLLALSAPLFASPFTGLTVTRIEVQDDLGRPWKDLGQINQLMVVKTGDRFSSEAVRDGISYLYLTGKFRDIRVDGFADGGGVRLVYTLVPVTVVNAILVRGNKELPASRIRGELRGVEGRELREDKFPDYRTGIQLLYQAEGYYGAEVDFRVEPLPRAHQVDLIASIAERERTTIGDIDFSGNSVFSKKKLLKTMKSEPGGPLRTNVLLDHDIAAIVEKYVEAGYPAVKQGAVDIGFREGKAFVLIEIKEGPKVTVTFSGNRAFSDSELRKQLLIWSERDASDAIIDGSSDKIRNLYQADGYDNVKVTVKRTAQPGRLDLVFDIQEGKRITVERITVDGNRYFPAKQIRGEMALKEPWWFSSSPFRQDLLDKDVEYLRDRYQDAGFLSAEVKSKVDLAEGEGKANVHILISEGPQTRAGKIAFEGNNALTASQLLEKLSAKPGLPYNDRMVDEDRYRILSAYSDRGYLYARVEVDRKPHDGTIDVTYRITEDQPVRIGRIIVRGNESTKESAIRRELLLKPGDAYDYEKILKSQQRIYRFGYFSRVRFEPLNPSEKEYVKDMLLSIEERPAGSVEFGVGYGDLDRARGSVEVSYRNLWGLAHYAGVRFEMSDILTRSILNYQHPWFFGYDLQGKFALVWSNTEHINSQTREIYYNTREASASYGVEKKLGEMKASLTYAYENVTNYDVEPGVILSFQDIGHVRVSSLIPALVWDLRDDIFNPKKGAIHGIVLKEAMHQLGSQADFTKLSLQSSWYIPLGPSVLTALSARGGMAWPQYESTDIPLHERFYLGGSTTIRGYTQDSVGPSNLNPDGTTTPTGGSAMWLLNAEVRVMATEGFGFVLFSDAGRVWLDQNERIIINQPDQLRPPARASYGAGIRYGTPVGPLRIDYGLKINRRPGESPGELHFNIGHAF